MAMLLPIIGALARHVDRLAEARVSVPERRRPVSRRSAPIRAAAFCRSAPSSAIWFWRSPHKLKTLCAVVIAAALILPVLPQQFWDRMSTIDAPAEERDDSQQGRLHFWQVAVAMANDRPLIGVGHRGYEPAYNQYDWTRRPVSRPIAPCTVRGSACSAELGYPGLLLFVLIIVTRRCERAAGFGSPRSAARFRAARRVRRSASNRR